MKYCPMNTVYFFNSNANKTSCLYDCPDFYYKSHISNVITGRSNMICKPCQQGCKKCLSSSSPICYLCQTDYLYLTKTSSCILPSQCSQELGLKPDYKKALCDYCLKNCEICNNDLYYYKGNCLLECESNLKSVIENGKRICKEVVFYFTTLDERSDDSNGILSIYKDLIMSIYSSNLKSIIETHWNVYDNKNNLVKNFINNRSQAFFNKTWFLMSTQYKFKVSVYFNDSRIEEIEKNVSLLNVTMGTVDIKYKDSNSFLINTKNWVCEESLFLVILAIRKAKDSEN